QLVAGRASGDALAEVLAARAEHRREHFHGRGQQEVAVVLAAGMVRAGDDGVVEKNHGASRSGWAITPAACWRSWPRWASAPSDTRRPCRLPHRLRSSERNARGPA